MDNEVDAALSVRTQEGRRDGKMMRENQEQHTSPEVSSSWTNALSKIWAQ